MRWWLLLGVVCAVGCGTSQTPESPAPQRVVEQRSAAVDERALVAAFGDSLTDGYGVAAGQKYPDLLQKALDERGYKYRVVNAGVSGDTTGTALDRVASVVALKPKLVILEIGGNDGLRGLPLDQTQKNLEEILTALQKSGARVVMWGMTLPANYGPAFVSKYEAVFQQVAKKYKVPLIPIREELGRVAKDPKLMQPDGIHPTGAGYAVITPVVLRYVEPELKKLAD